MNADAYRPTIVRAIRTTADALEANLVAEDVEDLAQEVLLALWARHPQGEIECEWAYARQTARNVTVDALRRRGAKKRGHAQTESLNKIGRPEVDTASFEENLLARSELAEIMRAWRRQLSRAAFDVICLRIVAGLSSKEAAQVLGLSVSAVDCHLSRARRAVEPLVSSRGSRTASQPLPSQRRGSL